MNRSQYRSPIAAAAFCAAISALIGCQQAYYSTMERFGVHKRDILVDRVEDAREAQDAAKEQFKSALDRFRSVLKVDGGELEAKYDKLQKELDRSESRANAVHNRIAEVEDVAGALFSEWEGELRDYSNPELKRESQRRLAETKDRYRQLIAAMKRAEGKIEPVLSVFRDQVRFLKHSLNAQAIASIETELAAVQSDVDALIKEMDRSIAEADEFIKTMNRK
jgi:hypothetical protein